MVGSSGWWLEMGSARHCLAAVARQLKVNMKKNSNRYALQLETNGVQGKKGERILSAVISYLIFCRFLLLLVYFSFLAPSKKQFAFLPPSPKLVFQTDTIQQRKGQSNKIETPHLYFSKHNFVVNQASHRERVWLSFACCRDST